MYWGRKTWPEAGPYAVGHGLGLGLHERPFFNRMNQVAGVPEQTFREGMCLAVGTYAGRRGDQFGIRLEEKILVIMDGYERLSTWPIDELMECWLPYR
jgi:Xaa-Pro dipeptidase